MTPEGKVKNKIKKSMAAVFDTLWGYMPVQTGYGEHGIPDHIYCVSTEITPEMVGERIGVFVAIEAKTMQGKMTDYQKEKREEILAADGIYLTIYGSQDISDKMKLLEAGLK